MAPDSTRGAKAPVPNGSSAVRGRPTSASIMAGLGLPDFEKPSACKKRQRALCAALGTLPDGQIIASDLALCSAKGCAQDACNDACHFAAGRRRRRLIPHAHRMLIQHDGPLHLVTVVHPNWESPVGGLVGTGTRGPREWIKRRLNRLPNAQRRDRGRPVRARRSTSSSTAPAHGAERSTSSSRAHTKEQLRDAFRNRSSLPPRPAGKAPPRQGGRRTGSGARLFVEVFPGAPRRVLDEQRSSRASLDAAATGAVGGTRRVARFAPERRAARLFGCRRQGRGLVPTTRRHRARENPDVEAGQRKTSGRQGESSGTPLLGLREGKLHAERRVGRRRRQFTGER